MPEPTAAAKSIASPPAIAPSKAATAPVTPSHGKLRQALVPIGILTVAGLLIFTIAGRWNALALPLGPKQVTGRDTQGSARNCVHDAVERVDPGIAGTGRKQQDDQRS